VSSRSSGVGVCCFVGFVFVWKGFGLGGRQPRHARRIHSRQVLECFAGTGRVWMRFSQFAYRCFLCLKSLREIVDGLEHRIVVDLCLRTGWFRALVGEPERRCQGLATFEKDSLNRFQVAQKFRISR
jgi:hypothetical protein